MAQKPYFRRTLACGVDEIIERFYLFFNASLETTIEIFATKSFKKLF